MTTTQTNPQIAKLSAAAAAALETYAAPATLNDVAAGVALISYVKKGYLSAKDPADEGLLAILNDPDAPTAPMYPFLRKVKLGAFTVNEAAIIAAFS